MNTEVLKIIHLLKIFQLIYDAGALTGKYTPENPPTGPRGRIYTPEFLTKVTFFLFKFFLG